MEYSSKAKIAPDEGRNIDAFELYKKAAELESQVAEFYFDKPDLEPTRGVIVSSAAFLNLKAGQVESAKKFILFGLLNLKDPLILDQLNNALEQVEQYYLRAIDKENVGALNNLAMLYQNQKKFGLAEEYFLRAIDKEDVSALNNLAVMYWSTDKNKEDAWRLIGKAVRQQPNDLTCCVFQVAVSAWTGRKEWYQEHRGEVMNNIIEHEQHLPGPLIRAILYHDHSDYVLGEFEQGEYASFLQENAQVFHYVAIYFSNPKDIRLDTIPEKTRAEYDELVTEIKENRAFYGRSI